MPDAPNVPCPPSGSSKSKLAVAPSRAGNFSTHRRGSCRGTRSAPATRPGFARSPRGERAGCPPRNAPTARTSMRSAWTCAVGSSHRSSLLRTAAPAPSIRPVGHGDADVDAPVRRAPPADEQVVVGAGVDAHEPRPARRAGLRRAGRRRARPARRGPRPQEGTDRCWRRRRRQPSRTPRTRASTPRSSRPSHGCDPTAAGPTAPRWHRISATDVRRNRAARTHPPGHRPSGTRDPS